MGNQDIIATRTKALEKKPAIRIGLNLLSGVFDANGGTGQTFPGIGVCHLATKPQYTLRPAYLKQENCPNCPSQPFESICHFRF